MSANGGFVALVGSCQLSKGNGEGIAVYTYFENHDYWRLFTEINCSSTPLFLEYAATGDVLMMANHDASNVATMNTYRLSSAPSGSFLYLRAWAETNESQLFHICRDPRQSFFYSVHRLVIKRYLVNLDADIENTEDVTLKMCCNISTFLLKTETFYQLSIFVVPIVASPRSINRAFIMDAKDGFEDVHLYVKLKHHQARFKGSLVNYHSYTVDKIKSVVYVYDSRYGPEGPVIKVYNTCDPRWQQWSKVTYSLAPPLRPFLFIANCGDGYRDRAPRHSIAVFRVQFDGLLRRMQWHNLESNQPPRHLYFKNDFLYVTTLNSVIIFKVRTGTGKLTQVNMINQVSTPECITVL